MSPAFGGSGTGCAACIEAVVTSCQMHRCAAVSESQAGTGSLCTSGIACSHNSCSHSASWCTAGSCSCTSNLQYTALFAPQQMIPRLLCIQCCRTADERRPYARSRGHDSRGYFGSLRWKLTGPLTGRRSPCVHWDCRWLGAHSAEGIPDAVHHRWFILISPASTSSLRTQ